VQDILKTKQKQLRSIGKGNRPNADPLSDEDIDTFYSSKVPRRHYSQRVDSKHRLPKLKYRELYGKITYRVKKCEINYLI